MLYDVRTPMQATVDAWARQDRDAAARRPPPEIKPQGEGADRSVSELIDETEADDAGWQPDN